MTEVDPMHLTRLLAASIALLLTAGCAVPTPSEPQPGPGPAPAPAPAPPSGEASATLVRGTNDFGFRLYGAVRRAEKAPNLFLSPASVAMALAMTYNGAAGDTAAAMASTLAVRGMGLDDLNGAHAALRKHLAAPGRGADLTIANSLWARKGMPFKEDFLNRNRTHYEAQVSELDFGNPAAADTINAWVKNQTRGLIPDIVTPPISPDTILFLINAIYFKGNWTVSFDAKLTQPRPFTRADGSQKQAPLMQRSAAFPYLETDTLQAVALPYGKEGRVSMYLFLPRPGQRLDSFIAGLDAARWSEWMGRFRARDGSVALPRFKVESDVTLKTALSELGMGVAFDEGRADFSGMMATAPGMNVYLQQVKHKTFVNVDEEGTEAAAVTSVQVGVTSVPVDGPFRFVADRPFFFAIRDNDTGMVLFLGEVGDP